MDPYGNGLKGGRMGGKEGDGVGGRWGEVKIRVVAMHIIVLFLTFSEKRFFGSWAFYDCSAFSDLFQKHIFVLEKWPRNVWEWSGSIPDLLGPISVQLGKKK